MSSNKTASSLPFGQLVKYAIIGGLLILLLLILWWIPWTQEQQNQLGRKFRNWKGNHGVLEIYAGEKLVQRFVNIDKISTAQGTQRNVERPYRFGYGVRDANLNGQADPDEIEVYFEFSDYSTSYIYYDSPK